VSRVLEGGEANSADVVAMSKSIAHWTIDCASKIARVCNKDDDIAYDDSDSLASAIVAASRASGAR